MHRTSRPIKIVAQCPINRSLPALHIALGRADCGQKGASKVIDHQGSFTPKQAAKYVGISEGALRLWRAEGKGPRYFRAGEKLVRYRRTDLDNWIEERLNQPVPADAA